LSIKYLSTNQVGTNGTNHTNQPYCGMETNMEKIVVKGGTPLFGSVDISGMKNAALPIIFACVLVNGKCTIENIPRVRDVEISFQILKGMGAVVNEVSRNTYEIDCSNIKAGTSSPALVSKLRASYYLWGTEFGRFGYTKTGHPGGCNFADRPVDQHIKGFEALGGRVVSETDFVEIHRDGESKGANIYFDVVTVGGTVHVMLASVLSGGVTIIENAAREPHIVDLANFLNRCGAKITGAGTEIIKVRGVKELHGCTHDIIPDMIEAGTFMIAAAATRGAVTVNNVIPKHMESLSAKLEEIGVTIEELDDSIRVDATGSSFRPTRIKTMPYPGFPTDMQPQMCVLLTQASGQSMITEGIYETRFRYVDDLVRMGAQIKVDTRRAIITGGTELHGADVTALDLRAGVAMVIAGLIADGETSISNIYCIERGYDDLVGKLTGLGANVFHVTVPDEAVKECAPCE